MSIRGKRVNTGFAWFACVNTEFAWLACVNTGFAWLACVNIRLRGVLVLTLTLELACFCVNIGFEGE